LLPLQLAKQEITVGATTRSKATRRDTYAASYRHTERVVAPAGRELLSTEQNCNSYCEKRNTQIPPTLTHAYVYSFSERFTGFHPKILSRTDFFYKKF